MNNYRPISVLNNLGKILEMSIRERLEEHIEHNKIISKNQFGFRKNLSTEDAIFEVTKTLYNSIEKNKKQIAIFIDLAKAFDTVCHKRLIEKLNNYGIRGVPNQLINSYLEARKQCVKIDKEKSNFKTITCGIPQGTILGPILFSLYINELLFLNMDSKIVSYADDTVLVEDNSWESANDKAVMEFSKISQWLNQNCLTLNISKTKFMYFSIYNKHLPTYNKISLHSYKCLLNHKIQCTCKNELHITDSIKYLGVIIDKNLKWTQHIEHLNTKIRKLIWKFYNLREILPKNILKMVYYALAESILRYGISIWGGTYVTNIEMIKSSQRYLLKVILHKDKRYPTNLLFEEFDVLDITQLYIHSVLSFTYKNRDIKEIIGHQYQTRNKSKECIRTPQISKTSTQRFITYFGPKCFNILPLEIRQINNKALFNKKAKLYLKQNKNMFIKIILIGN